MVYEFTISTPANTSAASPLETVLDLESGIISDLFAYFLDGNGNLHRLTLFRGGHQALPKQAGYLAGNDKLLEFKDIQLEVLFAPYEMVAKTWNLDDTWSHDLHVLINLKRQVFLE